MLLGVVYTACLLDNTLTTKIEHFTINDGQRGIVFESIFTIWNKSNILHPKKDIFRMDT